MKKGETKGSGNAWGLMKTTDNVTAFARRPHIFSVGLRSWGHRVYGEVVSAN